MRKKHSFLAVLLLAIIVILLACEPAEQATQPPPTIITLLPPVITETPRFTATLPPSITPTPSDTPTVTMTPSPVTPTATSTLTPTPPIFGVIVSSNEARVRDEPSFNGEILSRVTPGTRMEIHAASIDQEWIFVRFVDADNLTVEGWVNAPLLDVDGDFVPPTITSTPTNPPTATRQVITVSGTPVTPGPRLSQRNVRANCRETETEVPRITTEDTVSIWWSWFVARPELMDDHIANANYVVLLDGRLLTDYDQYRTEIQREGRDWYVYWYVPVNQLAAGPHQVSYRVTWDQEVFDGYDTFGPGTENESEEGTCVFTVE